MGNSPNRLYNALAQTLSSAPLSQHIPAHQDQDQDPVDPVELLRECEEALRARPARLHRAFVCHNGGRDCHQQQPIRVMQWNILAQGKRALHILTPGFKCASSNLVFFACYFPNVNQSTFITELPSSTVNVFEIMHWLSPFRMVLHRYTFSHTL